MPGGGKDHGLAGTVGTSFHPGFAPLKKEGKVMTIAIVIIIVIVIVVVIVISIGISENRSHIRRRPLSTHMDSEGPLRCWRDMLGGLLINSCDGNLIRLLYRSGEEELPW